MYIQVTTAASESEELNKLFRQFIARVDEEMKNKAEAKQVTKIQNVFLGLKCVPPLAHACG